MESNSIYNHKSDLQNRVTAKQESEQFQTEVDDTNSPFSINQKFTIGYTFTWKKKKKKPAYSA